MRCLSDDAISEPLSVTDSWTMYTTCDDYVTIYVDGALLAADLAGWSIQKTLSVPSNMAVMAVLTLDTGGVSRKGRLSNQRGIDGHSIQP